MIELKGNQSYKLICGDCFETLKDMPDASIDLILTDPPYNLANYSTGNMKFDWRAGINNDVAEWDEEPLDPAALLIGVELEKEYVELTEERLERYRWLCGIACINEKDKKIPHSIPDRDDSVFCINPRC